MEKSFVGIVALVALVVGGLLGFQLKPDCPLASSSPAPVTNANFTCTNSGGGGGSTAGGESAPFVLPIAGGESSREVATDRRFGASFGETVSTTGGFISTSGVTSTSFLAATTLTFGVNAGTVATATRSTTPTSTLAFPGRTCFNVVSPTGTMWFVTFENGVFNARLTRCDI